MKGKEFKELVNNIMSDDEDVCIELYTEDGCIYYAEEMRIESDNTISCKERPIMMSEVMDILKTNY